MSLAVNRIRRSSRSAPSSTRFSTAITSGSLNVLASGNRPRGRCTMRRMSRKCMATTPSRPRPCRPCARNGGGCGDGRGAGPSTSAAGGVAPAAARDSRNVGRSIRRRVRRDAFPVPWVERSNDSYGGARSRAGRCNGWCDESTAESEPARQVRQRDGHDERGRAGRRIFRTVQVQRDLRAHEDQRARPLVPRALGRRRVRRARCADGRVVVPRLGREISQRSLACANSISSRAAVPGRADARRAQPRPRDVRRRREELSHVQRGALRALAAEPRLPGTARRVARVADALTVRPRVAGAGHVARAGRIVAAVDRTAARAERRACIRARQRSAKQRTAARNILARAGSDIAEANTKALKKERAGFPSAPVCGQVGVAGCDASSPTLGEDYQPPPESPPPPPESPPPQPPPPESPPPESPQPPPAPPDVSIWPASLCQPLASAALPASPPVFA